MLLSFVMTLKITFLFSPKCGLTMKCIGDKCDLLEEDGKVIDMETDERGDFHFNALLDAVADWRKHNDTDCSLGGRFEIGWFYFCGYSCHFNWN